MPSGVYKKKDGVVYGNTGKKATPEKIEKLKLSHLGQKAWNKGLGKPKIVKIRIKNEKIEVYCPDCNKKIFSKKSKKCVQCSGKDKRGENSYQWIKDRNKLKRYEGSEERRSPSYKEWRKRVCNRDLWKCKIDNLECSGRLEVHHILGFTDHPELKYDINNGICLCHFHHPRMREEEKRLVSFFKELVSVSK